MSTLASLGKMSNNISLDQSDALNVKTLVTRANAAMQTFAAQDAGAAMNSVHVTKMKYITSAQTVMEIIALDIKNAQNTLKYKTPLKYQQTRRYPMQKQRKR